MNQKVGVGFLIAAIILGGFFGLQVISMVLGHPMIMVTIGDSMLPVIQPFDLIVLEPLDPDKIEVGMIVAADHSKHIYPIGTYLLHRVIFVDEKGQVLTKGDTLERPDLPVPKEKIVSKMIFNVPILGFILGPPISIILILGFLFGAYKIMKRKDILDSNSQ